RQVFRGKNYVLNVPSEIELTDCNKDPTAKMYLGNGRSEYVFSINTETIDIQTFESISCRMRFDSKASILEGNIKNTKTFAARARYEYKIESTTTIVVEK
ncbi:MAG TPA: hypothetical protein V6C58_16680, partial [Allocoleopsis sp.]